MRSSSASSWPKERSLRRISPDSSARSAAAPGWQPCSVGTADGDTTISTPTCTCLPPLAACACCWRDIDTDSLKQAWLAALLLLLLPKHLVLLPATALGAAAPALTTSAL
jgi:hypothetical protein